MLLGLFFSTSTAYPCPLPPLHCWLPSSVPQIALITWIIDKIALCLLPFPPHLCIWQVLQSILLYNDRSVCCPIMTHGLQGRWLMGGTGEEINDICIVSAICCISQTLSEHHVAITSVISPAPLSFLPFPFQYLNVCCLEALPFKYA